MSTFTDGRHEHGQNFLTDPRTIAQIIGIVSRTQGPLLEIGPGRGALTLPLQKLERPLTAVEIHPGLARTLEPELHRQHNVVTADFLSYPLPREPHVIVGNLPFHLTTAILRKLLHDQHWEQSILLTQWEVARRRAGVGGSSMMTAQWAPYYEFTLAGRVSARAFTPAPSVDGGIFTISRRSTPLVPWADRKPYAQFVHAVFTGPGRGMARVLRNTTGLSASEVGQWSGKAGVRSQALPKDLTADQWAALWSDRRGRMGKTERAGPAVGKKRRRRR